MKDEDRDKSGAIAEVAALEQDGSRSPRLYEAWRDLEAQYAAIIEAFDGLIYICSQDYEVEFMNGQFIERTGGYPVGQKCYKALHNLENVCPWCVNERVFRGEKVSWDVLSPKDNRWYHVVNTPIRHGDGTMSKMAMIQDITARKEAEEALDRNLRELQETAQRLEQSRNMLQLIIESIPVRVFWKDKESRFMGCNTLFARDAGLSKPEQLLGQDDFAIGWREQAELYRADDRQVMDSGRPKMNIVEPQTTPMGDKIWVNTSKVPLQMPDGEVFGVLGVYEDITERKRAEEALRESEERYRNLVENISLGITMIDSNYRIIMINDAQERWFDKPASDFIHKECFRAFEKREAVCSHCPGTRAMATGLPAEAETIGVRDDGSRIPVHIHAFPTFAADGQANGFIEVVEDISERKEADNKLAKLRHHQELILNSAWAGILGLDPKGRITFVNLAAARMLGYGPEELIDCDIHSVWHHSKSDGSPYPAREGPLRGALEQGETINGGEDVFWRHDGSSFPVKYSLAPILEGGEVSEVTGAVLTFFDTSQQKEEQALTRSLIARSLVGVYLMQDRKVVLTNQWFHEITGYSEKDLANLDPWILVHPEDREGVRINALKMLRGESFTPSEFRYLTKGGETKWVMETVTSVQYKGKRATLGYFMDITERKQAEEALRQANEILRATLDAAPVAIFDLDSDGRVKSLWNRAAEQMFGWRRDEVLGHFLPTVPEDSKEEFADVRKWLLSGKSIMGKDVVRRRKDGSRIEYSIYAAPEYDDHGKVVGAIVVLADLTERKQAERLLTEQFRFLQHLIDAIPSLIFYKDVNGVYLGCSQSMADFLGRPKEEIIGKTVFDIYPPEQAEKYFQMDGDLFQHPGTQVYEFMMEGADGANRNFIFSKAIFADSSGKVAGLIGAMTDITERKRMEEELKDSEQRLKSIFENATDGFLLADFETKKFILGNKAIFKMLGYGPDELYKLGVSDIHPPGDLPYALEQFEKLARREITISPALTMQRKDGSVFYAEVNAFPLTLGGKIYLMGIFRDVTERKRAEEELGESLRRNQLFFDSLPSIALSIRADLSIVGSNQAAARAGAVPGQHCYATLWGFDTACPWCKAQEALQTGKPLQAEIEAAGKVWDSHWIPINSELFLHFVYDITELKEAERERAKLREQLFQAQKMEAIGTLAGGIAHDFNNILSAIIGYGEILDLFHSAECPQIKPDLQGILKAAFRAKDLVQQILTFSRKTAQDRLPLKLLPVIRESLKFLRASLPSTIEIMQSLDPEVGPVLADPTQMQQVVMNLGTNAVQSMGERGGVLEVRLTQVMIGEENGGKVLKLAPGLYARLTVKDSGHGIPPEILTRIFEPYFTTKGMGEGTGLGLAIVEGIVQGHGGVITVESGAGGGTVFQVFLPIVERNGIDLPPAAATQIPRGQGRILLVDDEPALTDMGQEILKILGYEVEALTSSTTALEHFRQHPLRYDLAILDLTMPQMTGAELAREILQIRPDLPIILTSGFAEQLRQEESKNAGIRALLKKPFRLKTLAETINQVLG